MKHLLLLLALLLVSLPVQAAKPNLDAYEDAYTIEIVDCGDFSVMDDVMEFGDIKTFFDKDGNFARTQIVIQAYDELYRDDDPEGVRLSGKAQISGLVSFDENGDELWTQQGKATAIMVPGYGSLFMDVGRLVYNVDDGWDLIFSAGKQHDWNFGDFEALCEFFE
ncbi:MAG: hypothetical protein OQJ84_00425 [Xanthomonadales bacterium]|nr:hypothetical protein [Xanthomonadales bacterium]